MPLAPDWIEGSVLNTLPCTDPNQPCNANTTIHSGPSAATNEMCMGVGWFFPGTAPIGCLDSTSF